MSFPLQQPTLHSALSGVIGKSVPESLACRLAYLAFVVKLTSSGRSKVFSCGSPSPPLFYFFTVAACLLLDLVGVSYLLLEPAFFDAFATRFFFDAGLDTVVSARTTEFCSGGLGEAAGRSRFAFLVPLLRLLDF